MRLYVTCNAPIIRAEIADVHWNGDNNIQNFHLGRYIVKYTFGNHVLRLRSRVAIKLNFRPYIRRYTSPNENFEHSYPLIHCLLLFPLCCGVFVLCGIVLNVLSSLAIHFTWGRESWLLSSMCSCCRVTICVLCLFLLVPGVGL